MAALAGREKLTALAGRVLCVAATVWMAWTLAGMLWLLSGHGTAPLPAPAARARPAAPAVDVGRLASLDLFGAAPAATGQAGAAASAPDTTLQLRLAGVFVNADQALSSAIVADRNNPSAPAKSYGVNETLPGGAVLAEVHDDRILLRRGENSEILRFEKTGLLDGNAAAGPAPAAAPADDSETMDVRDALGNAIQALTQAPEAFIQQMGLKPGPNGYEITDGTPEELREALGLQAGDSVMSINGRRLGNPRQDREVLAALRSSGFARVEIQRGGQVVTIERKF
ncbi:MAG: type II secretion system protein N [Pseudomonadota bacterium]